MTPEILFDRAALACEKKEDIGKWAEDMRGVLQRHKDDKCSSSVVEALHDKSMAHGIFLQQQCYHSGGSTSEDIARTLGLRNCPGERAVFSFEPDGSGYNESIEMLDEIIENAGSKQPDLEVKHFLKISHALGKRELQKKGYIAFAIDAIALGLLDRVSTQSLDFFISSPVDCSLSLGKDHVGKGKEYLENRQFQKKLDERTPTLSEGTTRKSEAQAFTYFDMIRRLDLISMTSPKNKAGTLRGDTIFLEHSLPQSLMLSSSGKPFDDILETPVTKGLGLKVVTIEPSGGIRPGIAVKSDAKEKLTIITRKNY